MDGFILVWVLAFMLGLAVGFNLASFVIKILLKKGHVPEFLVKNKEILIPLLESKGGDSK